MTKIEDAARLVEQKRPEDAVTIHSVIECLPTQRNPTKALPPLGAAGEGTGGTEVPWLCMAHGLCQPRGQGCCATLPLQQQPAAARTETRPERLRAFTLPWSATDDRNCASPNRASKCLALDHLLRQHRYKS